MTGLGRALVGALVGAVAVLIVHPVTRPHFSPLLDLTASPPTVWSSSPWRSVNARVAPLGSDDATAAYWLLLGAQQSLSGRLSPDEDLRLLRLAETRANREPDNAFWHQAEAVFAARLKRTDQENQAWRAGARALRWNDYQTVRLQRLHLRLTRRHLADFPWHWAALLEERSPDLAGLIARRGIQRVAPADTPDADDLSRRAEALANAVLLRDGGRQLAISGLGMDWIEAAARTGPAEMSTNQRRLMISRYALVDRFRRSDRSDQARMAVEAFAENDAWLALVPQSRANAFRTRLTGVALGLGVAPAACLLVAVGGLGVAGLGWLLRRAEPAVRWATSPRVIPVLAAGVGLLVYATTRQALESFWLFMSLSFFALVPSVKRSSRPEAPGLLFSWVVGSLAVSLGLVAGLAFARGTQAWEALMMTRALQHVSVLENINLPWLATVLAVLLVCVAPTWSMVQRYAVAPMLSRVLETAGVCVAWAFSLALIVCTMTATLANDGLITTLRGLAENEAAYHLAHGHDGR